MEHSGTTRKLLPALAVGMLALGAGIWASLQLSQPVRGIDADNYSVVTMFPVPRELPALELINDKGEPIGRDAFTGRWSMVFMGFTSCGHTCPMAMAEIRSIHDQLNNPVDVVFFSVDPGRDTPATLQAYVQSFDSSFKGMTGSPAAIETFAGTLGAPYFVDTTPDNYIVEHSSAVFLINPSAALAGVISQPFEIDTIVEELDSIL